MGEAVRTVRSPQPLMLCVSGQAELRARKGHVRRGPALVRDLGAKAAPDDALKRRVKR